MIISGTFLGNGSDITAVELAGVPATILSQDATSVKVLAQPSNLPVTAGIIAVTSISFGVTQGNPNFTYTYNAAGVISQFYPNSGPLAGGNIVVINGTNLGSGSDITAVTLAGVSAEILSQTAASVVVMAVGTKHSVADVVVVMSVSRGTTTSSDVYTYNARMRDCIIDIYSLFA